MNLNEFQKNTAFITRHSLKKAVEIGCYEGETSMFIVDHLMQTSGRLFCIDPLKDEYLTTGDESAKLINADLDFKGQFDRFSIRTKRDGRVRLIREVSDEGFKQLKGWGEMDFVYIDGDHRPEQVYKDAVNALGCLKIHGWILFDDFHWEAHGFKVKDAIVRFYRDYYQQLEELCLNSQFLVRRIG